MELNQLFAGLDRGCLLRDILRRIWMVLLAALIAAGCMNLVLNVVWTPSYTSSATYAVMSKSGISTTMNNLSAANEAASMMSELLESEVMSNRLREELGSEVIPGRLTAQVVGETNMLSITATAGTAEAAFRMMQVAMDSFDQYFSKVDSTAVLQKISDARVPLSPGGGRSPLKYLLAAALAGAGAMVGLLLWLHIKADTIQSRRGAKEKLDAQVLVTLPHEKKNPLITDKSSSFYFKENFYRLRSRIETAASASDKAVVILVTSVAANEGKSTVAANLALTLAEKHKGVMLIDADLRNPSLLEMLGKRYGREHGLGYLLSRKQLRVEDITGTIGYSKKTNLMTILEKESRSGATDMLSSPQMVRLLNVLRRTVKYIVLDAPPIGIFPDGSVLADLADLTVLVVRQDMVSACDINDAADTLGQGRSGFLGVVLNDMRGATGAGYGYSYGYGYGYGYGHKRRSGYGYGYGYGYGHQTKAEIGGEANG